MKIDFKSFGSALATSLLGAASSIVPTIPARLSLILSRGCDILLHLCKFSKNLRDTVQDGFRSWRTTWDVGDDWYDLVSASEQIV